VFADVIRLVAVPPDASRRLLYPREWNPWFSTALLDLEGEHGVLARILIEETASCQKLTGGRDSLSLLTELRTVPRTEEYYFIN
jgi:hypothetical protein